jgi:septum formation protein
MNKPHDRPKLILASKSPRRSDLLEQAGLTFSIVPSDFDESSVAMSDPESYVETLAKSKAIDISEKHPDSWVLGADTIVLIDNSILGKPGSKDEARSMLKQLSGKTHQVITGYCLCCQTKNDIISETVKTDVRFKTLSDAEIEWYIQTGEPFDKAGAYAIQGIGTFLVKSINGSYANVVGLPVCEVIEFLINKGVVELNLEVH